MDTPRLAKQHMVAWHLLERYHIDPVFVFAKVDLDPQIMYEENGTYPSHKILNLWDEMANIIPDPQFGLKAGDCWHPAFYGNLGYATIMCPCIRSALETVAKYNTTIANESRMTLTEDFNIQTVKLSLPLEEDRPGTAGREDSFLSIIKTWLKFISVKKIHFVEININHKPPNNPSKYYELFKAPINFDASETSLVINSEVADFVLPAGSQALTDFNEKEMRNYALQKKNATVAYRTTLYIEKNLENGAITIEEIAKNFSLSTKSLQRSLKREGTGYKELVELTRNKLAEKYLKQDKDLSEIAYLLGFSEQSAFSRAFKKYTGSSPSEYRKQLSDS